MQNHSHFAMVSPAPGFTVRVMARLAERERARARRRALIGSALLVGAASAMLAFAAIQLVSAIWILVTNPQVIVTLLNAFELLAFWVDKPLGALWIAANVIAENLDPMQMTLCAAVVFVLTMLWVRVVTGSFQSSFSTNHVGGL
jgi:hypothetical protein